MELFDVAEKGEIGEIEDCLCNLEGSEMESVILIC